MTAKRFIIKTIIKIITFIILTTFVLTLIQSSIIKNYIYSGQMENSDDLFILMELYNKVLPIISIMYGCITAVFVGSIIYDIYKFIDMKRKVKKDEETKKN